MQMPKRKFTAADLIPGKSYRVVVAFADYGGGVHPAGECWCFIRQDFLPYEDGLTLFLERNGREVTLRLQWRAETQAEIIDSFSDFVEEL
jgi:hypothetical protein